MVVGVMEFVHYIEDCLETFVVGMGSVGFYSPSLSLFDSFD